MPLYSSLLIVILASTVSVHLTQVRTLYIAAASSEKGTEKLYETLKNYEGNDPVILGYKGVSLTLKAKFGLNPYTRYTQFKEGSAMLDQAIANHPENIELRYLRFMVQTNCPSFLDYDEAIEGDKKKVFEGFEKLKQSNSNLATLIRKSLLASEHCTAQEKTKLKNAL